MITEIQSATSHALYPILLSQIVTHLTPPLSNCHTSVPYSLERDVLYGRPQRGSNLFIRTQGEGTAKCTRCNRGRGRRSGNTIFLVHSRPIWMGLKGAGSSLLA